MAKAIGGHIVGMSTALEAIAARQAGMEILGMSLITNLAAGIQPTPLSHAEVIEAGQRRRARDQRAARAHRRRAVGVGGQRMSQHIDPATRSASRSPRRGSPRTPTPRPAPSSPRCIAAARGRRPRGVRRPRRPLRQRASPSAPPGFAASSRAGPNRMNRVLVAQAAAGLAAYLSSARRRGSTPSVVIGYDGRKNSDVFARDSAEIMAGAGVRADAAAPPAADARCSRSPCGTSDVGAASW